MARPLPDDLQKEIAETATKAEIRSVAIFSFVIGAFFGATLMGSFISEGDGDLFFGGAALILIGYWYFSSRKRD